MDHRGVHPQHSRQALLAGGIIGGLILVLVTALALGRSAEPTAAETTSFGNLLVLLPAAFLTGLLSFLAPCTLPLLPAYFAYRFGAGAGRATLMTVAFVFGLATTLTLLGASATALSRFVLQYLESLTVIGGVLIIAFGVLSLLGKGFAGLQIAERPAATIVGSYVYGVVFALGWTTCIGPILGAVLTLLAAQGGAIIQGATLAFVYALGLGTPLIIIATFFDRLGTGTRFWRIIKGRGWSMPIGGATLHLHSTSMISGLLLIAMGALLASGQLAAITTAAANSDLAKWVIELEIGLSAFLGR